VLAADPPRDAGNLGRDRRQVMHLMGALDAHSGQPGGDTPSYPGPAPIPRPGLRCGPARPDSAPSAHTVAEHISTSSPSCETGSRRASTAPPVTTAHTRPQIKISTIGDHDARTQPSGVSHDNQLCADPMLDGPARPGTLNAYVRAWVPSVVLRCDWLSRSSRSGPAAVK
jgi:hypothetical protein